MRVTKKAFSDAFFLYTENILRIFYNIAILVLFRNILSAESFSLFAFYITVSLIVYSISKFSLDTIATKYIIEDKSSAKELLCSLMLFRFFITGFIIALLCICLLMLNKFDAVLFVIIVGQLFRIPDSIEWYLRANSQFNLQSLIRIFSLIVTTSLIAIFVISAYEFNNERYLVVIVSIEWIFICIAYLLLYIRLFGGFKFFLPFYGKARDALLIATPILFAHFISLIYGRIDQLALESYLDDVLYGQYIIAARINDALLIVVFTLNLMIMPTLVSMKQLDECVYKDRIRFFSRVFFGLSVVVISFVWGLSLIERYLSLNLIAIYLGEGFLNIFKMLVLSSSVTFYFGLRSTFYVIEGWSRNILYGSLVGLAFGVFIGVPSMAKFGVEGGIFSVTFSAFFALFVTDLFSHRGRIFLMTLLSGGGRLHEK